MIGRNRYAYNPTFLFFISSALFPIIFFSASQSKLPGYILPAVPPLAIFSLIGFMLRASRRARAPLALARHSWRIPAGWLDRSSRGREDSGAIVRKSHVRHHSRLGVCHWWRRGDRPAGSRAPLPVISACRRFHDACPGPGNQSLLPDMDPGVSARDAVRVAKTVGRTSRRGKLQPGA